MRELKNVIERAVLEARDSVTAGDISFTGDLLSAGPARSGPVKRTPQREGEFLLIDEDRITGLLERSRGRKQPVKEERPYYLVLAELERKLILLSLRESNWKIKPAAELLGINHLSLRSKLMTMLNLFLEEADGDVGRASRDHGIPPKFFTSKLHLLEPR